jgi:REP element-mobilizing transposase RayT
MKQNQPNTRRSIRLKKFDYSTAGLYFITICTQSHLCLFGKIIENEMNLNGKGLMVRKYWLDLSNHFKNIKLHEFIVMPNHIHTIFEFFEKTRQPQGIAPTQSEHELIGQPQGIAPTQSEHELIWQPQGIAPTVGDVVGAFKSLTTNAYIKKVKMNDWKPFHKRIWQRNYYEQIVRSEKHLLRITEYIQTNPLKWHDDKYFIP